MSVFSAEASCEGVVYGATDSSEEYGEWVAAMRTFARTQCREQQSGRSRTDIARTCQPLVQQMWEKYQAMRRAKVVSSRRSR